MQLLFKRAQTRTIFRRPVFRLWARMHFEGDEQAIIRYYKFEEAKLIEAIQPGLVRRSTVAGLVAFLLAGVALAYANIVAFEFTMVIAILVGLFGGWLYYDRMRETIYVRDLIHGRYFRCRSVIDLARKEAWLELITAFLRQVMETARYWDGTEAVPIEALSKQEAKYTVISGL